jgi:thiosulfate dehydrogenase [quinone] large subunit
MKKNIETTAGYSNGQIIALTSLRILIGWHFLYEGLTKILTPGWTSKGYLIGSVGPLSNLFKSMAQSETVLNIVDFLNEWGLVLIGLSLFIGLLSKAAKISGIILLLFYYLAYPPFAGLGVNTHVEGSYWIVNKNLIEIAALFVLHQFPSSHITGIDKFVFKKYRNYI